MRFSTFPRTLYCRQPPSQPLYDYKPRLRCVKYHHVFFSRQFPVGSLESTLRYPLTLINEGNATAAFSWANRGAFSVSPEKGTIGPRGKLEADVVWTPQPGCKSSETLVLKVRTEELSSGNVWHGEKVSRFSNSRNDEIRGFTSSQHLECVSLDHYCLPAT